jgi:mannose-6-phosphate isomerase-like protein (cupin superfamily)
MADDYAIVHPDDVKDSYEGSDVPGEFRRLTKPLGCHDEVEELYLVVRGTLTMRFGDDITKVGPGNAVRVAPRTARSHRNEGDEPVEMWAISRQIDRSDATKIDDFWEASPDARRQA